MFKIPFYTLSLFLFVYIITDVSFVEANRGRSRTHKKSVSSSRSSHNVEGRTQTARRRFAPMNRLRSRTETGNTGRNATETAQNILIKRNDLNLRIEEARSAREQVPEGQREMIDEFINISSRHIKQFNPSQLEARIQVFRRAIELEPAFGYIEAFRIALIRNGFGGKRWRQFCR